MPLENQLSKALFLHIAKTSGLTIEEPYTDKLFNYVNIVLSSIRVIEDLDLSGIAPLTMTSCLEEEAT